MAEQFPGMRPYDGEFTEINPHLTVAQVNDSQLLQEIASDFHEKASSQLPIETIVSEVTLMDNENGHWEVRRRFALGAKVSGSLS